MNGQTLNDQNLIYLQHELKLKQQTKYFCNQIQRCHTHQQYALTNSITDMFYLLDKEQRYTMVAGKWLEQYGLDPDDFLGKNVSEALGAKAADLHAQVNQRALKGETVIYEWAVPFAGHLHHYQTAVAPLLGGNKETVGVLGIGREITDSKLLEEMLHFMNRPFNQLQSNFFSDKVVSFIAQKLEVDHVLIGRLTPDKQHVRTITYWVHGQKHDNITYELENTPCDTVMNADFCCYNHQVSEFFPADEMLVEAHIEAYAGQPLLDSEGNPIGLIAVLNERPFANVSLIKNVLQIAAIRTAHELEQRYNHNLMRIQKNLAFHISAAAHTKEMTEMIIAELLKLEELDAGGMYLRDEKQGGMYLVSHQGISEEFVSQSKFIPFTSAWVEIIQSGQQLYRNQSTNEHQRDQLRTAVGLKCTANLPILHNGEMIAVLSVGSYHIDEFSQATKHLLESIASQIGGALARATAEALRHESEERYRSLVSAMAEGVVVYAATGEIVTCNASAEQILGLTHAQMMGLTSVDFRWPSIHEDGTPFPGETHPAMITLQTGEPQQNVIMGVHKPDGQLTWVSINSQPIYQNGSKSPTGVVASFTDITERILAETAVRRSKERYRQMFETNQAIKFIIDPETGRILEANTAATSFYGYTQDQLLKMRIADINIDSEQNILRNMHQTIVEGHGYFAMRHRLASGEIRDVEIYSAPVDVNNQRFLYSIVHDVTQRRKAEAQLNKLSQAVEQSSAAIVITDTNGSIEYVNSRFTKISGYELEDVIGRKTSLLKSGYTPSEEYAQLWATIRNGHVWQGEFYNRRKDNSYYWESASISPIRDEHGQITNFLAVKEDISEKKMMEKALKQRNQELQLLYNASRSLGATLDLDEVLTAMMEEIRIMLNVGACAVWIIEEESGDLVCRQARTPVGNLIQGWHLTSDQGVAGATAAENRSFIVADAQQDIRHPTEIDQYMGLEIRSLLSVPLRAQGKVIGVFQIIDDNENRFTQADLNLAEALASAAANAIENAHLHDSVRQQLKMLRKAQERLLQSEKLAAIGELVAGVAHELNNPLTAVVLYSQLVERRGVSDLVKRDLSKIVAQAQRASNVVKGLLDFARQQPPAQKPTQLNDVISSTAELLSYELRSNNIQFQLQLQSELPVTMADPHQLQQVLVNLIQNAIHAMGAVHHTEGRLAISTYFGPSLYLEHEQHEESVIRITVSDNGSGIPADVQSRVFDPFFTTKATGVGTGLGLSVCHGIVSEHGGYIWFETVADEGTTFFIELPLQIPEEMLNVPEEIIEGMPSPQAAEDPAVRILIIDDESTVRHIMSRILQREGYKVYSVENGREALIHVAEHSYDLIVCDLRMPEMSGIEFYEHLAQKHPELAHKILFSTGDTVNLNTQHFFKKIQANYLTKPFEINTLLSMVHEKLQQLEE